MFRYLNKIIRNDRLRKVAQSTGGQAAVVLILVIAIVLIFYAVSLNFGHMTQVKGMVTVASNTSASMLASSMASYTQSLSETQLGGTRKKCGWTGIFAALIVLIIMIIAILLAPETGGTSLAAGLAIAGMVLAGVSLVLQIVVIQPGITAAWNRITSKTLSLSNQIVENAIQSALSKTVTDGVSVPDVVDGDGDGLWVADPSSSPPYADRISRYAAYYTQRVKNVGEGPAEKIREFLDALEEFVHEGSDGWGIHDHMIADNCFGTSECHPCCVPDEVIIDDVLIEELRPEDCEDADWEFKCAAASPYGPTEYPWMYDPTYENPLNGFYSLRELIGKDDEHQDFYKYNVLTPSNPPLDWNPNRIPQNPHSSDDKGFYLEDATNFYIPLLQIPPLDYYPDIPENHKGIYPFFHKMADWGVDLSNLDPSVNPRECHWCDIRDSNCPECGDNGPHPHPVEITQLDLPDVPDFDPSTLVINTTNYVDGNNDGLLASGGVPGVDPPLWADKVDLPTGIIAKPEICAEGSLYPTPTDDGFWKPGSDQYCSSVWPYTVDCLKNAGICWEDLEFSCGCGDTGTSPEDFPDDALDNLYLGLGEFTAWAEALLTQGNEHPQILALNFTLWYPDAARWIEPSGAPCIVCDLENPPEGYLHVFLKEMIEMRDRIEGWITQEYRGSGCGEVWCVPDSCSLVQTDEKATFGSGNIDNIVACLNHNANYKGGNAERFEACYNVCSGCQEEDWASYPHCVLESSNLACGGTENSYLPRTLIPDFDPNEEFEPIDWELIRDYVGCPGSCQACYNPCGDECGDDCNSEYSTCRGVCSSDRTACKAACLPDDIVCTDACDVDYNDCRSDCISERSDCRDICDDVTAACKADCVCTDTGQNCMDDYGDTPDDPPSASVLAEIEEAKGSCAEDGSGTFLDKIERSIPEATNQVAKFQKRKEFLQGRLTEAKDIVDIFTNAIDKFEEFLTGPVEDLINTRANFDFEGQGIPNFAIYGWKGEDDPDGSYEGKWHIVKVDARITGHCDNSCGSDQKSEDPGWPWIRTYTKKVFGLSVRRCYELEDYEGSVKFRTTRYDEERASGVFNFPNGVPIWNFRTLHPKAPGGLSASAGGLGAACAGSFIKVFDDGSSTQGIYDDAFILNGLRDDGGNAACWNLANNLLTGGVVTETCAKYKWHGGRGKKEKDGQMDFEFVRCDDF